MFSAFRMDPAGSGSELIDIYQFSRARTSQFFTRDSATLNNTL